ncbi:hypothetical protein, partial [Salmonella enterica]|uniref:hypothetical protein n=1 Tax=Salmonella enterica TaxID=28901 RepID=UPI0035234698
DQKYGTNLEIGSGNFPQKHTSGPSGVPPFGGKGVLPRRKQHWEAAAHQCDQKYGTNLEIGSDNFPQN